MSDQGQPPVGETPYAATGPSGGGDVAFELAPVGLAEALIDGTWLRANAHLSELLGYARSETPRRLWDVIHPEDVRATVDCISGLLASSAERCELDQRWRTRSGSSLWVAVSIGIVRRTTGEPDHLVLAVDDISDRKQVEQRVGVQHAVSVALAESETIEQALTAVLEALGRYLDWQFVSCWMVDEDGVLLVPSASWAANRHATREFEQVTQALRLRRGQGRPGRSRRAGAPAWISDVLADDAFPRRATAARAGLRSAFAFPIRVSGEVLGVVEVLGSHPLPPDEALMRTVEGVGHQVGQFIARRRATEAERASHARAAAMLEAALDSVVTIDHTGRIIEFNPAAERTFGFRQAEVIGRAMVDIIIPPAYREAHRRGMARYLATGQAHVLGRRLELPALRADGREFPCEVAITRVALPGPPVFTAYLRDRSEQHQWEQRQRLLRDASALLSSSLDYESTLRALTRLVVPALADWYAVDLLERDGRLRRLVVAHRDPEKVALAEELDRRYPQAPDAPYGAPHVVRTGQSEMAEEIADEVLEAVTASAEHRQLLRALGLRSYIVVPMTTPAGVLGALTLVTAESGRRYTRDDLAAAEELARQAAQAIENARSTAELRRAVQSTTDTLVRVADELRQPVVELLDSATRLTLRMRGDAADTADDLARVDRAAHRLLALTDELARRASAETGHAPLAADVVRVGAVLAAATDLAAPLLGARGARLEQAPVDPSLTARADRDAMLRIVRDLLTHPAALTATPGTVALRAETTEQTVEIRVHHTGVTGTPEVLAALLAPLEALDARGAAAAASAPAGGGGPSLAIERELARRMGGDLTAAMGPDGGLSFVLRVPRATGTG